MIRVERALFPLGAAVLIAVAASIAGVACSDTGYDFHPLAEGFGGAGGSVSSSSSGEGGGLTLDSGSGLPPALDAGGLCGNQIHPITSKPPTIYFIFDVSGSMTTPVPGGTRYSMLQAAAATLVNDLRSVIRVGAAAFPLETGSDACHPGAEIFAPAFDDPLGFEDATANIEPYGGTPTAATISALTPSIAAIGGDTIAILTTDGGANCDANAMCTTADCTENIEGCAPADACCAENANCCSPTGPAGPLNCLDRAATIAAVGALAKAGVRVYVIGIPGSEPYGSLLTQMAFAGGAPMASPPYYYNVQDLTTLASILKDIAGGEVSCNITIDQPPSTPGFTNVYFGDQVVPYGSTNGWTFSAPNVVTLNGSACVELRSGEVAEVQVVSGCPTQTQ